MQNMRRHLVRRAISIGKPTRAHRSPVESASCLRVALGASCNSNVTSWSIRDISSRCLHRSLSSAQRQELPGDHTTPSNSPDDDIHILLKDDHVASASTLSTDEYDTLISELEETCQTITSELPQLELSSRTTQIHRFIWECSRLWASGNEAPPNYISRGAQLTEKMMHIALKDKLGAIEKDSAAADADLSLIQPNHASGMRTDFQSLCTLAVSGLARSDLDGRGERAQAILDKMEDLYIRSGKQDHHLAPSRKMYNLVLVAYAKSSNGDDDVVNADNVNRCIALIDRMKKPGAPVKPVAISYNVLLDAYSRLGDANSAQQILEELERAWESSGGDEDMMPCVVSYSCALSAWERSGDPNAAQKAEEIVLRMVDLYHKTGDKRVAPNQITLGTCIALHAQNRYDRNNVENAERMLDWLIQIHRENGYSEDTAPNGSHFASVLNAWSKSRRRDSAIRAEETLQKMEDLYNETGSPSLKPNHQCFVFCVDAWARSNHREAAKNAERILKKMESLFLDSVDDTDRMNNFAYNILTSFWAKRGERGSSERIQGTIHRLTEMSDQTNNEGLAPDKFTYTSLMLALVNEKIPGNLEKCGAVLDRMEDLAERTGKKALMPDEMAYATIMNGYSHEGNAQMIESLIRRMKCKGIPCTDIAYNILLNAIVKIKAHDVAERAEDVLKRMAQELADGNSGCRPSIVSYITCIKALSRSHDPNKIKRALKLFETIAGRFKSGDESFRPSERVLGSVLDVVAKSNEAHKVSMCLGLIDRMKKEYGVTPNRVAYNIVLSACAHHIDPSENEQLRREVLKTAVSTFQLLSKDGSLGGPDSTSYRSLLLVVDRFIIDEGERMASMEDLWNKCCKDGQVNQWVLQALFKVSGPHFWRLVDKDRRSAGIVKVQDLPPEWSRNTGTNVGSMMGSHHRRQKRRRGAPRQREQRNWR